MKTYTVKSGQNIFDAALIIHGSVEGIFDLLLSNDCLTLYEPLEVGQVLLYHENFVINEDIVQWLENKSVNVKNGHNKSGYASIQAIFLLWLYSYKPSEYDAFMEHTKNYREAYLKRFKEPRIIINQTGVESSISAWLYPQTYMIVDWGDNSAPQIIGNEEETTELSHGYLSSGNHEIKIYGNFSFYNLDFTEINGIYYLLDAVYADDFTDALNISEYKTLIEQ